MKNVISIHPSVKDYTLLVAIDFGTTRSGFVYCFLDHGADEMSTSNIHNFDDWHIIHKYQNIPSYAKDRTELLYQNGKLIDWGWGARMKSDTPGSHLLTRFKLKLQLQEDFFKERDYRYTTSDVVLDYLKSIKEAALTFIHGDLQFKIPDSNILWCLTIPAIWNHIAVDRMKTAALKAFTIKEEEKDKRLFLVREPEAAAVHCYFNQLNNTLQSGQTFMVIDAGGGTIDLTSYKVSATKKLEEIAKSSGGQNGSTFVDLNFIAYLGYLGLNVEKVDDDNKLLELLISWEQLKHAIDSEELSYSLPLRGFSYFQKNHPEFIKKLSIEQKGVDDEIIFKPEIIKELFNPKEDGIFRIFNPVFKGVKNDIQNHIDSLKAKGISSVDYVFLVGGFNRSKLLREFIISNFKHIVKNDPNRFIKPLRPEQAIMEGACLYGINPSVIHSRISKLTYGLSALEIYNPQLHVGRPHRILDDGIDYCMDKNKFLIMCRKNESVEFDHCVKRTYTPAEKGASTMTLEVFCADIETPIYTNESGVKKLGDIPVPMPSGYSLDIRVEVRFYFGKSDIRVEAENLQTKEVKNLSVKFSSSFG